MLPSVQHILFRNHIAKSPKYTAARHQHEKYSMNPKAVDRKPHRIRAEPLIEHPKYEKIEDLSQGAFGVVQLCRNKKNKQLVAIKFLERVRSSL